jgi:hypothetical protein
MRHPLDDVVFAELGNVHFDATGFAHAERSVGRAVYGGQGIIQSRIVRAVRLVTDFVRGHGPIPSFKVCVAA